MSACGGGKRIEIQSTPNVRTTLEVHCSLTEEPLNRLADAIIEENTPKTVVAADEFITIRDRSCNA